MDKNQKERSLPTYEIWSRYRNALMGFAILSIILFHFIKDYRDVHNVLPEWMDFYFRYFGSAGVDIFLFLSGFGLYYSFKNKNGKVDLKFYLYTKLSRVLIPYFVIAIPACIARRIFQHGKDWTYVINDLFFVNFFKIGESWYWYIGMICFCYLVFPLLFHYVDKADNLIKEIIRFVLIISLVTAGCHLLSVYAEELYKNINGATLRFLPFILGTFIGKRSYEKKPLNWVNLVWLLPWCYYCSYAKNSNVLIMRYMLGLNGLVMCFFLCLILWIVRDLKWHPVQTALEFLGKYTLELYLTHVTLRVVMNWYGWQPGTYKKELVMLCMAAVLSAALKIISNWIYKKIKGIGREQ